MNQHLYDKIAVTVAIAMMHKGPDDRHNGRVVAKITRDIMECVREELPQMVDIEGKWELGEEESIPISLEDNYEHDGEELTRLARFASDQGYNLALGQVHDSLYIPLPKPKKSFKIEKLSNKGSKDGNQSRTT